MDRTSVVSSNLKSVGYDVNTKILEIEFQNGSVYQYYEVPLNIYEGLMKAPSHGKFFHARIRNVYRYRRIK
ncbi:MAG TPA: KTSC domain-containing protein [Candidatus Desulfofervidus auxilii]|uniref:KTSC domain-containing protein n=1 Tax=Desulfofervidus auxilii TaxID=1621989 RepID=A0A7C0U3J9_DESA2|nr:KTSC domain-containing protein [Candidatus Desulfofervidus auxilii]